MTWHDVCLNALLQLTRSSHHLSSVVGSLIEKVSGHCIIIVYVGVRVDKGDGIDITEHWRGFTCRATKTTSNEDKDNHNDLLSNDSTRLPEYYDACQDEDDEDKGIKIVMTTKEGCPF